MSVGDFTLLLLPVTMLLQESTTPVQKTHDVWSWQTLRDGDIPSRMAIREIVALGGYIFGSP